MSNLKLVVVAGHFCSGKSTLCAKLHQNLGGLARIDMVWVDEITKRSLEYNEWLKAVDALYKMALSEAMGNHGGQYVKELRDILNTKDVKEKDINNEFETLISFMARLRNISIGFDECRYVYKENRLKILKIADMLDLKHDKEFYLTKAGPETIDKRAIIRYGLKQDISIYKRYYEKFKLPVGENWDKVQEVITDKVK